MTDPTFADFQSMTIPPLTVERIEFGEPRIAVMHGRRPNSTRCGCGAAKVCAVDAATLNAGGRSARAECDHDEKWAVHRLEWSSGFVEWELTYHPPFGPAMTLAVVRTWRAAMVLADFAHKGNVRVAAGWTRATRDLIDAL